MIDLRLGDCLEILKTIPDKSIDCIVTDPPYGNTVCRFDCIVDEKAMLQEFKRVTKPNRAVCIFSTIRPAVRLINLEPKFFRYEWIWEKKRGLGFFQANKRALRCHEIILVFGKGNPEYYPQFAKGEPYKKEHSNNPEHYAGNTKRIPTINEGKRYPRDVLHFGNSNANSVHPTQKPVDLLEYLIRTYSKEGEVIFDPFSGSGSTAIACIKSKRNFIGCEIDEKYWKVAIERIEKAQKAEEEKLPLEINE